ncbi:MAG: SxtJ family membrane protein [Acidobacteriota bacterium]
MLPINRNPAPVELRRFARLWLPLFVALVGGIIWWRSGTLQFALVAWSLGALAVLAGLTAPSRARAIFIALQVVTYPIGLVVSTLVLAFLFFAMFTPLGLGMRLAGRDPLRLRARHERSHWLPYDQKDSSADAFKQY